MDEGGAIGDGKKKLYRRTVATYGVRHPHEALSLEAIAALSAEGLTRLSHHVDAHAQPAAQLLRPPSDGVVPSASPHGNRGAVATTAAREAPSSQRHHLNSKGPIPLSAHQAAKSSNAPPPPPPPLRLGSDDDNGHRHDDARHRKERRDDRVAAEATALAMAEVRRKEHYVATLEGIVEEAEERHQAVCAMLLSTAVRGAASELFAAEAQGRCAILEAAMLEWGEMMQSILRRHHVEHSVLHHRIRSLGADHSELKAQSNPMVSTTAQAYVLNDLRQVLEKQHTAQLKALGGTQDCFKTVVETHAATLHHAVARLQDQVHALVNPVEAEVRALAATLAEERRASAAAGLVRSANEEERASQQSLRLAELNGALRVLEDHTRELLSAASSQRQLILEDLSRRAAVDERRAADQKRSLDELMTKLLANQSEDASRALARAASTTFTEAAAGAMTQVLRPMLADAQDRITAGYQAARTEDVAAQQLLVAELPESIRRTIVDEVKALRAEMQAMHAVPPAAVAASPPPAIGSTATSFVHATLEWHCARCEHIDASWAAKCEAVAAMASLQCGNAKGQTATQRPDEHDHHHRVVALEEALRAAQSKLAAMEAAEKAKFKAYEQAASPFVPPHALEGVVHVAPRSLSALRSISGVSVSPSTNATEQLSAQATGHPGGASATPNESPSKNTAGPTLHDPSPDAVGDAVHHSGMSSNTRRRVSRDMIIPFSSVEVDIATTPDGTGAIGPSATTSPSATPISPPHGALTAHAMTSAYKLPAAMGLSLSSFSPRVITQEGAHVVPVPSLPVAAVDPPFAPLTAPPRILEESLLSPNGGSPPRSPNREASRRLSSTRHPLDTDDSLSLDSAGDEDETTDDGGDANGGVPATRVGPAADTAAVAYLKTAIQRSSFDVDDDDDEPDGGKGDARLTPAAISPPRAETTSAQPTAITKTPPHVEATTVFDAAALLESPGRHRRQGAASVPPAPLPLSLSLGTADDGAALSMLRPGGGGAKKKLPTW